MKSDHILMLGVAAGFVIVPFAAGVAPSAVNGLLILLLAGIILMRSDQWLPYLNAFADAFSGSQTKPHPVNADGPGK